jgi:leucyl aminopeptidase
MSLLPIRVGLTALSFVLAVPVLAQAQVGSGVVPREQGNSLQRPVEFAASAPAEAALVIFAASAALPEDTPLSASEFAAVDAAIKADRFEGKANDTLVLRGIGARPMVAVVGIGSAPSGVMEAAGTVAHDLMKERAPIALVGFASAAAAADAALGYQLGQYRFDRYHTGAKEPPSAQPVTVITADATGARAAFAGRHAGIAEGVRFTRDLVSEPANVIYPESFIERTRAAFRGLPVQIEVLDEAAMRRLNMGAILGVGQGSQRGSRLLLVTYKGADGPPLALVGKGITFDSGGISLKGGSGMWEMKADMAGAAAVVGTALSLARTRAPVHVVAVAALAENLPGGNAQRPGDVVRTYSGKTIEVINTDAEGRLVLADALGYVADKRKPFAIVDIATLTGGAVNALGPEYAGLFAREDAVADRIETAAAQSGEAVWRLPLHPNYRKAVESSIADVRNSDASPAPGASSGAHFIEAFVAEDMPWAHIDMAPTMWADKDAPLTPKGASGYGVRLLDTLAREWKP